MTEDRDLRRPSLLVRAQRSVYRLVCLRVHRPGNMFIFYLAGHEVRTL